ncbi:MAG: tetratricopeptide repeat protein [Candidatus Sumerlaeia bacterium]
MNNMHKPYFRKIKNQTAARAATLKRSKAIRTGGMILLAVAAFALICGIAWSAPDMAGKQLAQPSQDELRKLNQLLEGYPEPMYYPVTVISDELAKNEIFHRDLLRDYFQISFLLKSDQPEKALELFEKYPDRTKWPSRMWLLEISVLKQMFKLDAAISRANELLMARPDYIDGYIALADLYSLKGNREQAIETLNKARKAAPQSYMVLQNLHRHYSAVYRTTRSAEEREAVLEKLADVCAAIVEAKPGRPSAPYLKVLAYIRSEQGKLDEAIEHMEKITHLLSRDIENYIELTQFLFQRDAKDYETVEDVLTRASIVDPNNKRLVQEVQNLFIRQGVPENIIDFYKRLAEEYPGRSDLQLRYALALITHSRDEKAIEVLHKSLQYHPLDAKSWLVLARTLAKLNREAEATEALERYLAVSDSDPDTLVEIIRILLAFGYYEKAAEHLGDLQAAAPENPEARDLEIQIYRQIGDYEGLARRLKSAIADNPEKPGLYGLMVEALMELDRLDEAMPYLEMGLQSVPEDEKGLIQEMKILAYQSMDKYDTAIQTAQKMLDQEPMNWRIQLMLISLYQKTNQLDKMQKSLDDLLAKHQADAEVQYQVAMIQWEQENFDQVETSLRKAIELDPNYAEALNSLGYLYAEQNENLNEALKLVEKALMLKPNAPHMLDSLGWIHYRMGQFDKAVKYLELAAQSEQNDLTVLEHLGDAYQKLGRKKDAVDYWRRALQEASKDEEKNRLDEKIRRHSD